VIEHAATGPPLMTHSSRAVMFVSLEEDEAARHGSGNQGNGAAVHPLLPEHRPRERMIWARRASDQRGMPSSS